MSNLISFQYFVLPPGVTSTARYHVLIDKMCLYNTIQYNTIQNPFIAIGYILVTTDI